MPHASSHLSATEEGLAFLQKRVAMFGALGAGVSLSFLVYRMLTAVLAGQPQALRHASFSLHLAAGVSLLLPWLACRHGVRSAAQIRAAESLGVLGAGVAYAWMGTHLPLSARPDYVVLLALSYGLFARAIYVPSTGAWTLGLSATVAAMTIGMTYWLGIEASLDQWRRLVAPAALAADANRSGLALELAVFNAAWWACTLVTCYAASHVIYGLHVEMRHLRRLGQYTLVEELGRGGMGVVYLAQHAMLRRPTAVKLLPPERAGHQSISRFEREVQLTAALTHPNTVRIFDYGRTPQGVFYYAMELLEGATVQRVVHHGGAMPAARVVHVLKHCAAALREAHGVGLVHRDIKPSNIMLAEQGGVYDVVKVLDFGLVKQVDTTAELNASRDEYITGTPHYIAPEALTAPETVDERSDLYALAAVGYFALTGRPVFEGRTLVEVCSKHLYEQPDSPAEALGQHVSPRLQALLLRCLQKDREARPRNAQQLLQELCACEAEVGGWDEAAAREWWRGHAQLLRRHAPPSGDNGQASGAPPRNATLNVDATERLPQPQGSQGPTTQLPS